MDLTPRVEGDFFFAEDDPQMQASEEVERRFPLSSQVILRVSDALLGGGVGLEDAGYIENVQELTATLLSVEGVTGAFSVATDNPSSPLFRRILLTPDPSATNVILQVDDTDPEVLLPRIEGVVQVFDDAELDIVVSGVPVIVELIRRSLFRDLVVFSGAAVLVFALLMLVIYGDPAVVVGTLSTCFVAVALTLLAVQLFGIGIGLLTANLVTIVFVLTLSHVVFLTGNWRQASGQDAEARIRETVRATFEGSFWSMATTLLGFASLLVASARPLRERGVAGVVGAATAIVVAYTVYPGFLAVWAKDDDATGTAEGGRPEESERPPEGKQSSEALGAGAPLEDRSPTRRRWILPVAAVGVLVMAVGVFRVDTDPGLLTYFQEGSELREGLSLIDADGGSSTLDVVVADTGGARVDTLPVFRRLGALQAALEADSAVGVVLSPSVLIEHARTVPLAGLLPVPALLSIASSPTMGGVGLGFVTPDRMEARFSLRMRETVDEPREAVMERVRGAVRDAGLEPVVVAGLYDLQAQLGRLIASSLRVGIGGLLLLFLLIAAVVSRSLRTTVAMWLCLASIPAVTLGLFGHLDVALDLITSPSANIALAIGADAMIHLVVRVRRLGEAGAAHPWAEATSQIGPPVLAATTIVCAGFGIFALSSFPPTQRFGMAVIVGTLTAAFMALVVLPRLALTLEPT